MDRITETSARESFHWDESERQRLNSAFDRADQISRLLISSLSKSTPEIDKLFDELVADRSLFSEAVASNLQGTGNYDTRRVNYYLERLVEMSGQAYYGTSRFDDIAGFAVELIGKQVDQIGEQLAEMKSSDDWMRFVGRDDLALLSTYIAHGKDPELKSKALKYFKENGSQIENLVKPDEGGHVYSKNFQLIMQLYFLGNSEEKQRAHKAIIEILKKGGNDFFLARFEPGDDAYHIMHKLEPDLINILRQEINKYGVDAERVIQPWVRIDGDPGAKAFSDLYRRRTASIQKTLENLEILSQERPESPKVLQQMFGINHFGRYPLEIILKQYDTRFDSSKPYGVILASSSDRNEAGTLNYDAYKQLFDQLGDVLNLRITECESKRGPAGIARRLWEFDKRYNTEGKGHKIGFLLISGHGNAQGDTVWLGNELLPFGLKTLTSTDLERIEQRNLRGYFEENIDVVLIGCSLGLNFAKGLSRLLQARVFAQSGTINRLNSLEVRTEGEKVKLKPEFIGVNLGRDIIYIKGEEVTFQEA